MVYESAPPALLPEFKRTKILATIGPSTNSYSKILNMMKSGVNGFRLNFSHGTNEERTEQMGWVRQASKELGKPVAIVQDLQGPKLRLGDFEGIIPVEKGQELLFRYKADYEQDKVIPTQYDLAKKVKRGERFLLVDGRVRGLVTSVRKDGTIQVRIENEGVLTKRKGINLPDTDFKGDILPKKDRADIIFGAEHDIDYVALSFVQTADDVKTLRKLLKNQNSEALIIAKVETRSAIEHIDEIIEATDAIMFARGDLGLEVEPESLPVLQRQVIGKCIARRKLCIVATQMLGSMTVEPEPTRAEVSDVATAVIVGADCVMLSDETASGRYPLEAVKVMRRIILYTQNNSPLRPVFHQPEDKTVQSAITSAVMTLLEQIGAKAVVAETEGGGIARTMASQRPSVPIIAVTPHKRVAQQLALLYGSLIFVRGSQERSGQRLVEWLREKRVFRAGDTVVMVSGRQRGLIGGSDTIKVRVME